MNYSRAHSFLKIKYSLAAGGPCRCILQNRIDIFVLTMESSSQIIVNPIHLECLGWKESCSIFPKRQGGSVPACHLADEPANMSTIGPTKPSYWKVLKNKFEVLYTYFNSHWKWLTSSSCSWLGWSIGSSTDWEKAEELWDSEAWDSNWSRSLRASKANVSHGVEKYRNRRTSYDESTVKLRATQMNNMFWDMA